MTYERITEDEHAASAGECQYCGCRTRFYQGADDAWTCKACAPATDEDAVRRGTVKGAMQAAADSLEIMGNPSAAMRLREQVMNVR